MTINGMMLQKLQARQRLLTQNALLPSADMLSLDKLISIHSKINSQVGLVVPSRRSENSIE